MSGNKFSRFKDRLEGIRADLLGGLKKTRQSNQEEEFTEMLADFSDDAARSFSRQMILNLGEQERETLKLVEEALYRIKNGGYGVCAMCEKSIPEARLDIVPFALHCVACMDQVEKEKQRNHLIDDDRGSAIPAPNE